MSLRAILTFFTASLLLISCSTRLGLQDKSTGASEALQVYRSGGVERFFLPNLSDMGRISELAQCLVPQVQYFDFNELSRKYGFDYKKSLDLQVLFARKTKGKNSLSKKDLNKTFYESFEEVDSGASSVSRLRSNSIFVIAIDSLVSHKQRIKLRKLIQEKLLPKAQVALISRCRLSSEIESFKQRNNLHPRVISIGSEFFSYFNKSLENQYFWSVNLQALLPKKKIIYITAKKIELQFIQGFNKQWDFSNL